ncbi:MAG: hypothetical protein ACOCTT_03090, partial [archaeon]
MINRVNFNVEKVDKKKKKEEKRKQRQEELRKKVKEGGVKKIARTLGKARENGKISEKDIEKSTKLLAAIKGSDRIGKENKKTAERVY